MWRRLSPLINEGPKILDVGIATGLATSKSSGAAGYGLPDFRGGPMWRGNDVGLDVITRRLMRQPTERGDAYGYRTPAGPMIESGACRTHETQETP